jgi:methylmalonyl-CoA mutase
MTTEKLLTEFPPVPTEAWEEVIRKDLKGADYSKKLIWRTDEGMAVKPYYRSADVAGIKAIEAAPGSFPFLRGAKLSGEWRIREEIESADCKEANQIALAAIAAGAEEIAFLTAATASASELALLLANLDEVPVHFEIADEPLLKLLAEHIAHRRRSASISTGFDPLSNINLAAETLCSANSSFIPFTIHADAFEEKGANAVEEIAFALAAGIDTLALMIERGIAPEGAAAALTFSFAIGSNYFFQIAKLRAFRSLWARAVESFGLAPEHCAARIHARTSRWNKTLYDPHVNILRATTEAMSAVLGGVDSLSVAPFDEPYKQPAEASRRLARNTQILLKQEAHFNQVADPGAGSYALESITDYLARQAWTLMQSIEATGGFSKSHQFIDEALAKSLAVRNKAVAERRRVFVGTNQYANRSEQALDRVDPTRISWNRATAAYEQLRLRTERHAAAGGKIPRVLLAEIGDTKMRAARSGFAANFFACAGFTISTQHFNSTDDVAQAAADLIVLCSSDDEYLPLAVALLNALKATGRSTPVVIAGNPATADQLTALGVADFIHIRSNLLASLAQWQQRLGIEV